jgi:NAD+ synthase/NAD+ synthase (glutamine-hydrolysing)
MKDIQVGILQSNPTIGDIQGNYEDIINALDKADKQNADILLTPELSLIGYPPMDILRRDTLYEVQDEKLDKIKKYTEEVDVAVVVGFCRRDSRGIYNSAVVFNNGNTLTSYDKVLLPTYDVFDGHRYFETGNDVCIFELNNQKIALTICEDAWYDVDVMDTKRHKFNPFSRIKEYDTDLILNLSASPYRINKNSERIDLFREHSINTSTPVVFCNQVGGNDELVFDGNSFMVNENEYIKQLSSFQEDMQVLDIGDNNENYQVNTSTQVQEMNSAICLGIEDYFEKTGFDKAIVGMSGGIDSTIATVLSVQALGADNVIGVSLPSDVTSQQSIDDAKIVAENLGIDFEIIDIAGMVNQVVTDFDDESDYSMEGLALENIQARIRGDILMSLSNTIGALVITPDNKSESAIGYCTLYGDTVGAIAPLGDCYKRHVYELAEYHNSIESVIPQKIISKEPTAELKEDQVDSDEMSEYETLDTVLNEYVENRKTPKEITIDSQTEVNNIISRIHGAEFKRNQSPLPIRVTKKDFGRGWRYPIAADYSFLK